MHMSLVGVSIAHIQLDAAVLALPLKPMVRNGKNRIANVVGTIRNIINEVPESEIGTW